MKTFTPARPLSITPPLHRSRQIPSAVAYFLAFENRLWHTECAYYFRLEFDMEVIRKTFTEALVAVIALTLLGALGLSKPQQTSTSSVAPISVTVIGSSVPHVQATIYSASWCNPCKRYIAEVNREMPPVGWIVKDSKDNDAATAHVITGKEPTAEDNVLEYPTTIIRKDGTEAKRIVGKISAERLADEINSVANGK